ncbi:MAG: ATP phosphoribosyltransferase [Desulfovibrionaceae bacterium]|nr:ATP phosphoribosyltransferase [Desulfovibrionaceae bacterium]
MSEHPLIKLGIPKGSLEETTINLFERAGWKISRHARNYFPDINDPEISVSICRVQEIGSYVHDGIMDVGITGQDWLVERGLAGQVQELSRLVYSKVSMRPCRWVLAVANESPYKTVEDLRHKRIATELVNMTKGYFQKLNIPCEVFYSWGATEAKIVEGLADGIVEVTETGSTIKAQGLRVIAEVMESCPILISNEAALNNPEKKRKIEQIELLLQGALKAQSLVAIKMNVPVAKLEQILAMLPALNSPTVSPLKVQEWLSVETVVEVRVVRDLIPRLCAAGAEGIIEYSLNKVI